MIALPLLRRLLAHTAWADDRILTVFETASPPPPAAALQEFAHVLAADELWLARLEGRSPRYPLWPVMPLDELVPLARELRDGYERFLDGLTEEALARPVAIGPDAVESSVADVLAHVAVHAHYHRGKITLLLRQAGLMPVPTDYTAWLLEREAVGIASAAVPVPAR